MTQAHQIQRIVRKVSVTSDCAILKRGSIAEISRAGTSVAADGITYPAWLVRSSNGVSMRGRIAFLLEGRDF